MKLVVLDLSHVVIVGFENLERFRRRSANVPERHPTVLAARHKNSISIRIRIYRREVEVTVRGDEGLSVRASVPKYDRSTAGSSHCERLVWIHACGREYRPGRSREALEIVGTLESVQGERGVVTHYHSVSTLPKERSNVPKIG